MSEEHTDEGQMEAGSESIRMKVIGVGGAGTNMVDRLMLSNPNEVHLSVVNTDQQALSGSPVSDKHCIGKTVTYGLGTGGDPQVGKEAAKSDEETLSKLVNSVDLLFIAAGLGGGTGTGVSPVVADLANRSGAVVIAFVAMPFTIERAERARVAKDGLDCLRDKCNAVIPLPNDLLIQESEADASLLDAFAKADGWIEKAIRSIWAMMHRPGVINLDFSQLRQAFSRKASKTLFGLGSGSGPEAVEEAISDLKLCPLLHTPEFSKRAEHLLVNIMGGPDLGIAQIHYIMDCVAESFGKDANFVMGAVVEENLGDQVEICVIGTSDVSGVSLIRNSKPKILSTVERKADKPLAEPPIDDVRSVVKTHRKKKVVEQHEFSFNDEDPRGEFEKIASTIFEGQDLDTPTYMRRGVKISI